MYNAPTHTPDEDALTITAHFKDGSERPCTMNRMGRTLDYLESDGERFERVRACEIKGSYYYDEYDQYGFEFSCGHSVDMYDKEPPNFCPLCGAKVKVGE